jgi:ATP/maltotriose-dependent transcriptional regulator MalT
MIPSFLATKLYVPPVRPDVVPRPRLIERLCAGLRESCKLTLVSAPAGFGKTTLLSEWISARDLRAHVAWVSLDEGDNDPARFMAYVTAALQKVEAALGQDTPGALQSPRLPSLDTVVAPLINQINDSQRELVLVLDDYHLIQAQPVHDAVVYLLDHMPPNLHLVVTTRSDPPLRISSLRARGQLIELRQADLRFTPGESTEFLKRVMGLKLSVDDVAALTARTEGWIAGLQMAALSMQTHEDVRKFIAEFTGSQHYILDYLIEEVLQRQPQEVQSFLLKTSVLDRMNGPLCDAVLGTGDSHSVLETLEHANLFVVPLDDNQNWYRYHHLFADLLRHRLLEVYPGLAPDLHRRASEWLERAGQTPEAIDHALFAQDFERAARLVAQAAEAAMMRSQLATLRRWVEALPDDMVDAHPILHIYYSWTLLLSGHSIAEAQARLLNAERADASGALAGPLTVFRALLAVYRGDSAASVELGQKARELLPDENLFLKSLLSGFLSINYLWRGEVRAARQALEEAARISQRVGNLMNAVLALTHLGETYQMQGQLARAKAYYDQVLEMTVGEQGQRQPIAGLALIGLGGLLREWNDLEAAARYLVEGVELIKKWGEAGATNGYIGLAFVRQAQGDMQGARAAIQTAQQIAARFDATQLDDLSVAARQAQLSAWQGDLEAALRWAKERGLDEDVSPRELENDIASSTFPILRAHEYLILADVRLARGRPDAVLQAVRPLIQVAEKAEWTQQVIHLLVLEALACNAQGDAHQAMLSLERALTLAEPGGHVRIFVDRGEPMRSLISEARSRLERQSRGGLVNLLDYTARLLAAFSKPGPVVSPQSHILEPLSERELQVLRLLDTDLSSTDIAEELTVSVNTVRTHIRSIYDKLDAHSRYEAIARAKELGLL